jgi:hypothetical protein
MRLKVVLAASAVAVVSMVGIAADAWAVPPVHISGSFSGDDPIADCGTFEVRDEFALNFSGTEHFDRDGNVVRVVEHIFGVDRLYNSETGKSLKPASFNQGEIVHPIEGQVAVNGVIFRITVPGAGVVLLDVGRFVFTFDGGLVFVAGQHEFLAGDFAGLCAALA